MVSLGVCIVRPDDVSHDGMEPNSSPAQNVKPSYIVAGLGRDP